MVWTVHVLSSTIDAAEPSCMLFYKQPICKEPKCRMPNYLKNTPTKAKFRRELFNVNNFYYTKQSRVRKPVPFICSQNPHRLLAMPVLGLPFFICLTL